MRVLYLTNLPAPYRMVFFEELGKLCDLTVLIETEKSINRNTKWFLKDSEWSFRYISLPEFRWGSNKSINPSIIRWLNNKYYDIIVAGGYSTPTEILAILYMKMKGIPFVISSDGGFAVNPEPILKRRIKRLLISSAHCWLASGKGTCNYLEFYGADLKRTFLYPFTSVEDKDILPVPVDSTEKRRYKQILGISGELVLSVGQFIPRKGFDILLKAWNRIKYEDASLVIIGGGPEQVVYLETIRNLRLKNVKILDFMKKDELVSWYRAADVFVLPTRYDIWGLVINEAMAQGLAVVTTNGSLAGLELVRDGENGYLVPVEDARMLANRMETILQDSGLRQNMATCSLETIRPYTIENMAHVHIQAFDAMLTLPNVNSYDTNRKT